MAAVCGAITTVAGASGAALLTYVLILVYGKNVLESLGTRRVPILIGTVIATLLFAIKGYIDYVLGGAMLLAHALGVWLGAHFFLKTGEEKVRPVFVAVALILALKVIFF